VRTPHGAAIWRVDDNGDGTSTVRIATELPKNGSVRIVVEAEL